MFVFNCTPIINFEDYCRYISLTKANFNNEKKALFSEYNITTAGTLLAPEIYFAFRNRYRYLRQNVIKAVLKKFRPFLPQNCLIYEFGSLVKFTDRIESDVDLTICYDAPKTDLLEATEELINYSIVSVFEQSIDYIHGKFQHYPVNHDYDRLTERDNLYVLKFGADSIKYQCRQEALAENIMNIKNVRNYAALIEGYEEKYKLKCNIDCLYSIQILENTTAHDFLGDLAAMERNNDIFFGYQYRHCTYSFSEMVEVSYIKTAFKNTIVSMYIMISYLRKKIQWLNQYSMTLDDVFKSSALKAAFGADYVEKLQNCFIRMIFYWDKIELLLKKNKILLSTKCRRVFSYQQLNELLFKEYSATNMLSDTLTSINELNDVIANGWRFINQKYE